jgi:hypothetical protein
MPAACGFCHGLVNDIEGVLDDLFAGGHIPLLHKFGKLASLGRIQEKVQPGRAVDSTCLSGLAVAIGGSELGARSSRPARAASLFIHDLRP